MPWFLTSNGNVYFSTQDAGGELYVIHGGTNTLSTISYSGVESCGISLDAFTKTLYVGDLVQGVIYAISV